ncbi:MAG: (deoxy)nucleoside triphosphate pyrophosphohydrolase [Candidatus Wallbacteria bacterium]|nr:(deoxy)nucleoside triphosphate pyrophosphohydrolase [Candidatus Wallbacteria bacterium]
MTNGQSAIRPLKLVVAALVERDGRYLIARRPQGKHLGGLWEFPGGKMESGESPEECLAREMVEELDLTVQVGDIFTSVFHRYDEFDLLMLVFRCACGTGEPRALHCSEFRWATPAELASFSFPPADDPIVARLRREA